MLFIQWDLFNSSSPALGQEPGPTGNLSDNPSLEAEQVLQRAREAGQEITLSPSQAEKLLKLHGTVCRDYGAGARKRMQQGIYDTQLSHGASTTVSGQNPIWSSFIPKGLGTFFISQTRNLDLRDGR